MKSCSVNFMKKHNKFFFTLKLPFSQTNPFHDDYLNIKLYAMFKAPFEVVEINIFAHHCK